MLNIFFLFWELGFSVGVLRVCCSCVVQCGAQWICIGVFMGFLTNVQDAGFWIGSCRGLC